MGYFDFLKRRKKPKNETVKASEPSPEQTLFAKTVLAVISPTVEQFGFSRRSVEVEQHFTTIIFRKDKQYIKINGSTYPTDYPYSYNIIFGEGGENIIERDLNSIALWRLKAKIDPTLKAKEYEFPFGDKVKFSVSNANEELIKYANAFLCGNLTLFYETRSEQNKDRKPYKIYTPNENGVFTITEEATSVEQKKKYG
ncbi:MAG: hypothetical protein LBU73_00325 [Helicobacteraceae bacterium]|jgi:hypothetical protein|nr:hypothetical protein [Helicobacteraceae bacterium]